MDKALFQNGTNRFGTIITPYQANKKDSDLQRYQCLHCGEFVFLRQGEKNAHCFAHHKSESSSSDNECDLRVQNQYASYSTASSDILYIKKWFQQHSGKELEYNPHLPDFIFQEAETWKAIANILISEIKSEIRLNRKLFESKIIKQLDLASSSITRFMIDFEKVSEDELLDFYWEIFLRFRLLYRLCKSGKRKFAEGYYKELFEYFDLNCPIISTSVELIPFTFTFDNDLRIITCVQISKTTTKNVTGFDLNPPHSLSYKSQTPEISALRDKKYLVATYNPFADAYTSTNRQIAIGTQVLIVGDLVVLEQLSSELRPFTDEPVEIIKDISGLASAWGAIELILNNPENMSLSDCPDWIAWRYLELNGGLKIKSESKTYMIQCPPVIELNGNIPTELITVEDESANAISFNRHGNTIKLNEVHIGEYTVKIQGTPYSLNFFIAEASKQLDKDVSSAWIFHNGKWPEISSIDDSSKQFISGVTVAGFATIPDGSQSKEKEWFLIHSQFRNYSRFALNKAIAEEI